MFKIIRYVSKILEIRKYNQIHKTYIESRYADLRADYGVGVRIGKDSYVDQNVCIGDYSYVNKYSSLENCIVGKYCSISSGVYVNPYEHDYRMLTTHPVIRKGKSDELRRNVVIGNDVLISLNVIITEGVHIGNGAVVGAGAVVTKNVMPYEIVGGVPAKHIGWRFDSTKIKELEEVQWWNWDREKVEKNIDYLKGESDLIK